MPHATGTRLRCPVCGSETIIVKANDPQLECCGQPMQVVFSRPAPAGS